MAYTNLSDLFKGICDAIRAKKGTSGAINHQDIPSEIASIETGVDVSGVTAVANDVLSGKYYVNSNGILTSGTMATVTQPTPSISVSTSGVITATSTLSNSGYMASGTKSNTKNLSTKGSDYYTPTTYNQTIASGQYLTGTQTIYGDPSLVSSNIKSGATIFGVNGSYSGGKTYVGETYGTLPGFDLCDGWSDGSYGALAITGSMIYVPIDSTYMNVVPTSVSIIRKTAWRNGLIAALYKGASNGSGLRMCADDQDEYAIDEEGTGSFEFCWSNNHLWINVNNMILNSETYWYAVSYN